MSLKKGKFQHNQSKSLWNYTLSPGWREEEVKILKNALQLFGIGKWKKIMESGCLPGKSIGQIYMQTQRLLGQQSLGDFMGLQIDLEAVFQQNMKKQDVLRKNNCIINTGDNPTKEERKRRIEQNRKIYGLTAKQIAEIKLPKVKKHAPQYMTLEDIENEKFTNLEILTHLYNLKAEIVRRLAEQGETISQPSIIKSLNNLNNHVEANQNSNSSTETKVTLEQSGKKKYKVLAIEEIELQNGVVVNNTQKKSINGKRKNNRKINSDSEGDEEDISLEDIDSEESEINSEEIVEDDEEDEEIKEPSKIKKRKKNPEQESEEEEEEEIEEDQEEDELVVNEEEIFEDDEDDEDNQDSSEDDDDEED
ncbi:hypothetical protein ABPG74_011804 [Tetrahymena malaccensis]